MRRRWLQVGPELGDLVEDPARLMINQRGHPSAAIIIPIKDEIGILKKHLELLKAQSIKDFDVLIIHSAEMPGISIDDAGFGIVTLKESIHLGPAAAYYAGQRYALEKGYKTIILADVDCFPVGRRLVEKLLDAMKKDKSCVIAPGAGYLNAQRGSSEGRAMGFYSLNWYGAMDRKTLGKVGLTYLPLFNYGADDYELAARLNTNGISIRQLEGFDVEHGIEKEGQDIWIRPVLYKLRGAPLTFVPNPRYAPIALAGLGYLSYIDSLEHALAMIGDSISLYSDMLTLSFYKNPGLGDGKRPKYEETGISPLMAGKTTVLTVRKHMEATAYENLLTQVEKHGAMHMEADISSPIRFLSTVLRAAMTSENVVIACYPVPFFNPVAALAKNLYMHYGGKTYAIHTGLSLPGRLARSFVSSLAFASSIAFYLPISLYVWLRIGRRQKGYGITGGKG